MKTTTILVVSVLLLVCLLALAQSCSKTGSGDRGQASLQVSLTDDPGDFEAVQIDIQDVQVNLVGNGDNGWESLSGVHKGVYDLLTLVDDHDTLLADAVITSGRLYQLRLILGTENYVKVNGSMIQLNLPPGQQSGLTLRVQQYISGGTVFKALLDFDVARSVIFVDSATYNLIPAIRTVFDFVGGSFRGWVNPKDVRTTVFAVQGPDTVASTFTGQEGGYVIKGLAEGIYSLYFNPSDTIHKDSMLTGIVVLNKEVTELDTMFLSE